MMEELPAIIHRLSLRLWCPDQAPKQEQDPPKAHVDETVVNPFASPPLDPVDANGNLIDPNDISSLSLEGGPEVQSLFSQKSLLRLAALNDSHRTFSLFTPHIRDVVFRAWTGHVVSDSPASTPPTATPSLVKSNSFMGTATATTYTFSDTGSASHGYLPSRPSLVSVNSATSVGQSVGSGSRSKSYTGRKKKTRVVNLRKRSKVDDVSVQSEAGETNSDSASVAGPTSEPILSEPSIPEVPELPMQQQTTQPVRPEMSRPETSTKVRFVPSTFSQATTEVPTAPITLDKHHDARPAYAVPSHHKSVEHQPHPSTPEKAPIQDQPATPGLDQDWIMKMAGEIARRVYDEKTRHQPPGGFWEEREDVPPPAYEASR